MKELIETMAAKINSIEDPALKESLESSITEMKQCNTVIGASTKLLCFFVNDMLCLS
jgi:hypothetical protein